MPEPRLTAQERPTPERLSADHNPQEPPLVPQSGTAGAVMRAGVPTYYGRSQLKPAPFNNWVVGGYIFLAGLSGASALLAAAGDLGRGQDAGGLVRRGRYLSLLAPTVGSVLMIWDLHTPKRFYNMLRVAKSTSPMSIGTWILMSFSGFAGLSAAAQFGADRGWRWMRQAARVAQVPSAVAGAGLSTYTAALLSSTSTPLWAAAPRALAIRFGSSSVASGAAALSLGEKPGRSRRALDTVALAALAAELAAATASHRTYRRKRVSAALDGGWGRAERLGATGAGTLLPLGLHAASLLLGRRAPALSGLASLAILAGSALLRVSIMAAGDESARRPEISLGYAQPENLPR